MSRDGILQHSEDFLSSEPKLRTLIILQQSLTNMENLKKKKNLWKKKNTLVKRKQSTEE